MAKKKKQRKKSKKKYTHKGRGYFSDNSYHDFLYDNFRHGRRRILFSEDFAYAGRDTVNQAAKHLDTLAPKLVNQLMSKTTTGPDNITAKRVEQISRETGRTLKQIAPDLSYRETIQNSFSFVREAWT